MAELSAPVLPYRGLSQEQFRGFVLRNGTILAGSPLARVRSRFIRCRGIDAPGPCWTAPGAVHPLLALARGVSAARLVVHAPTIRRELTAPILPYRGLSQEQFRGIVLSAPADIDITDG